MRRKKAFTLIELLVVIGVISLLMAILLPALERARNQAYAIICRSNLKQWGIVFAAYLDDHDGHLPKQEQDEPWGTGFCQPWMYSMRDYCIGTEGIRCCPMAADPANPTGELTSIQSIKGGTFSAWGKFKPCLNKTSLQDCYYGSYGMNSWLAVPDDSAKLITGIYVVDAPKSWFWKTSDVKGPADIPVLLDSWWWCAWVKEVDFPPAFEGQSNRFPCGCKDSIQRFCINRHDGYVNALFLDSSVSKVGLKQLWTLKWHKDFNTAGYWTRAGGVKPTDWPEWMRNFRDY